MADLRRQLYHLSRESFRMPSYVDEKWCVHEREAGGIPLIQWPDGRWCHSANTYLRELYEKGLSRRNRGGSLAAAAAHVTHLIRFCWKTKTDFVDLTDNRFTQFISELSEETHPKQNGQRLRDANTVIAIGRDCIGFLKSVASHAGDDGLIGPTGRIRVREKLHTYKARGQNAEIKRRHLHHAAFPQADALRRRLPIKTDSIRRIRAAIHTISRTPHQRARRRAMVRLLEITGERRGEVSEVTVDAVRRAALMDHPMLKTITWKQPGGRAAYRWVPISKADVLSLLEYADVYRRGVMRRQWKKSDHGFLLVNGRTGAPLRPNTITQEIKRLAKAAGVSAKACPHMFRHRFITKLFVALIERHQVENKDNFRRLLLSTETLKKKVMEWTGHKSMLSLDQYLHLAFDEVTEYKKAYDHVRASELLDAFTNTLAEEADKLREGESPRVATQRLLQLAEALRADVLGTLGAGDSTSTDANDG